MSFKEEKVDYQPFLIQCRSYGSGYGNGLPAQGVSGRSFPFFFWPLVWGGGALLATGTYLDARGEVSTKYSFLCGSILNAQLSTETPITAHGRVAPSPLQISNRYQAIPNSGLLLIVTLSPP